jgi:alpha-D-ribose 1-methylphosphonate 5-triphosphate synthase subunit PhnH
MSAGGPGGPVGDGVLGAQAAFRALVAGLARPGTVARLPVAPEAPAGVPPRLLQVALVLLDGGVTFSAPGDGVLARHVGLLTGSRPVRAEDAAFLLATGSEPVAELVALPVGTAECPEDGATVVLAVRRFAEAAEEAVPVGETAGAVLGLVLAGPGIASEARVWVDGLDPRNLTTLARRNAEYPLGIDAFLVADSGGVVGLPRTVRLVRFVRGAAV